VGIPDVPHDPKVVPDVSEGVPDGILDVPTDVSEKVPEAKVDSGEPVVVKKRKGRPPKKVPGTASSVDVTPGAKRGRGRPKKSVPADAVMQNSDAASGKSERHRIVAISTNGSMIPVASPIKRSVSITDPGMIESTAAKRPVRRPRKTPKGVGGSPMMTSMGQSKPMLTISKEMVDKMMEKGKVSSLVG
jgi:hypothetical protein